MPSSSTSDIASTFRGALNQTLSRNWNNPIQSSFFSGGVTTASVSPLSTKGLLGDGLTNFVSSLGIGSSPFDLVEFTQGLNDKTFHASQSSRSYSLGSLEGLVGVDLAKTLRGASNEDPFSAGYAIGYKPATHAKPNLYAQLMAAGRGFGGKTIEQQLGVRNADDFLKQLNNGTYGKASF